MAAGAMWVQEQDMLKLYTTYRSRGARNIWLAKELGIPFEVVPVIQAYRLLNRPMGVPPLNTRSPEFLRINSRGQIPVMEDNGLVLTESLAINLYLARKHGGPLSPANVAEEGQMMMWSLWAVTEVEERGLAILQNRVGRPVDERDEGAASVAEAALRDRFPVLDAALAKTGWLVGGRFTVADINVAEIIRYALPAADLFTDNPHVKAWLEACHDRPAFKEMWATRDAEPA